MEDMESWSPVLKASVTALVCIIATALVYVVTTSLKKRRLPPGPFPWPIVGNIPSLGTHPHVTYMKMAEKYGNIFTVYLGSSRVVVVTNGAMAKEIMLTQDAKFASRPIYDLMHTCWKHMNPNGDSSFAVALWCPKTREMRQIMDRGVMLPRRVEATREARRDEVWRTLSLVEKAVQADKPVELRPLLEELGFRASCRQGFNKAFVSMEAAGTSELSTEVYWEHAKQHTKLAVEQNPVDIMPFLKPFGDLFGVNKKWERVYRPLVNNSNVMADWYRKNAPNADSEDELELDYLQMLMRKVKEGVITESALAEQSTEVIMAGAGSMAVCFEWCMLQIVRHPHAMNKLRAELDAKYGDSSPVDEDSMLELPYLQKVVKEALRLHPPAPVSVPHYSTEDAVIAGYHIPAGTSVITDLYAINRNKEDWGEDASEFNPDRFADDDVNPAKSSDMKFIVFGAGRRICPGRLFAVRIVALAMASLVHAFDWEAVPGHELSAEEAVGGLNMRCLNPLVARARPRPQLSLYR